MTEGPQEQYFFSDAKKNVGRQCILKRLHFFKDIDFDWLGFISDDSLRKNSKTIYPLLMTL